MRGMCHCGIYVGTYLDGGEVICPEWASLDLHLGDWCPHQTQMTRSIWMVQLPQRCDRVHWNLCLLLVAADCVDLFRVYSDSCCTGHRQWQVSHHSLVSPNYHVIRDMSKTARHSHKISSNDLKEVQKLKGSKTHTNKPHLASLYKSVAFPRLYLY